MYRHLLCRYVSAYDVSQLESTDRLPVTGKLKMKLARYGVLTAVAAIALIMSANAVMWLISPLSAAEGIKMPLLTGDALSSQMDIAAFFLGCAIFTVLALFTRRKEWFWATAILLLGAAAFRTVAWLLHGASLLVDLIAIEFLMGSVLLLACKVLANEPDQSR